MAPSYYVTSYTQKDSMSPVGGSAAGISYNLLDLFKFVHIKTGSLNFIRSFVNQELDNLLRVIRGCIFCASEVL